MDARQRSGGNAGALSGAAGRRLSVLAATLAAIGSVLVLSPPASATPARFTYELCDSALPGGNPPAIEFHPAGGSPFSPFQNCATPGGWVGVVQTGSAAATAGWIEVAVLPTPGGWVESAAITALGSGIDPTTPLHDSHVFENGFPGASGSAERIFHIRSAPELFNGNGGGFDIAMSCDGNVGACPNAGPAVGAQYIAVTEVDPKPPTLSPVAGSILTGGTLRGHQTLSGKAQDVGGGLSEVFALINGTPAPGPEVLPCAIAQVDNPSIDGTVATTLSPCPAEAAYEGSLDTEVPPFHEGANTVQLCANDFATIGNPNTTCSPAQPVDVDNSCTDSPVEGGELLSEQFATFNSETETVHYGQGAEVVGRLANNADEPVAGATLCVKLQTIGIEPTASPAGSVTTDAAGNYSYQLPPGPNRDIVVGFRHDSHQVARDVRLYSHVEPSLKASAKKLHDGQQVRFTGQLPGPGRRGRVVVLQANVKGSKRWITFRRATSAKEGIFGARYRFRSTTRKTTYRFRAVVPTQAGYPWMQGHSKPVPVTVSK